LGEGNFIQKKALNDAATHVAAPTIAARSNADRNAGPEAIMTDPMSAVATSPPVRATALLNPEADAVCCASTELSTAVVRGATAPAIPRAIARIEGNTLVQYPSYDAIRIASRKPAAMTSGLLMRTGRGPIRAAMEPAIGDTKEMWQGKTLA
jgi:hypothetical protein